MQQVSISYAVCHQLDVTLEGCRFDDLSIIILEYFEVSLAMICRQEVTSRDLPPVRTFQLFLL